MKVRKTGKTDKVRVTFGEHTDTRKMSKISSLKTTDKQALQITKGLFNKAMGRYPEDLRQVRVTVKGGYSHRYSNKLSREGIANNEYNFFSFPSDPDTQWSRKKILNHINDSMQKFTELKDVKVAGKYESMTTPRISEITIDYLYR
jgi:hypothetical protein